jgi:hypothetical protein
VLSCPQAARSARSSQARISGVASVDVSISRDSLLPGGSQNRLLWMVVDRRDECRS